ncbi:MAG: hypothetical protein WCH84_07120, partial [Verrucomicrobiota bacterium]
MQTKLKWTMLCATIALSLSLTAQSNAQLGGFGKAKDNSGGGGGDVGGYSKKVDEAVQKGLTARKLYYSAQDKLAQALGIKTDAFTKASEALEAKKGASSSAVMDTMKSQNVSDGAKQISDSLNAESKELSAEAKKKFAEGGGEFIKGVLAESELVTQVTGLVNEGNSLAQSASPLEKVKVLGLVKPVA